MTPQKLNLLRRNTGFFSVEREDHDEIDFKAYTALCDLPQDQE